MITRGLSQSIKEHKLSFFSLISLFYQKFLLFLFILLYLQRKETKEFKQIKICAAAGVRVSSMSLQMSQIQEIHFYRFNRTTTSSSRLNYLHVNFPQMFWISKSNENNCFLPSIHLNNKYVTDLFQVRWLKNYKCQIFVLSHIIVDKQL